MRLEVNKLIYDIDKAIDLLVEFTQDLSFEDYESDPLRQSAVERQFEILGEALNRLSRVAPETVARISEYQRIIAFRNILAHGYDVVSHEIVWDIVENKLPVVRREVAAIKRDADIA